MMTYESSSHDRRVVFLGNLAPNTFNFHEAAILKTRLPSAVHTQYPNRQHRGPGGTVSPTILTEMENPNRSESRFGIATGPNGPWRGRNGWWIWNHSKTVGLVGNFRSHPAPPKPARFRVNLFLNSD